MKNLFYAVIFYSAFTQILSKEVQIGWKPIPGAESYSVTYGTDNLSLNKITNRTNIILDLLDEKDYYVVVKAINQTGQSLPSKALFITTRKPKNTNQLSTPKPFIIQKYGHVN